MEKKKYCKNCIYYDAEYDFPHRIIGKKDTPIKQINEYCKPEIHNKDNDCPYFVESDFNSIFKKIINLFKKKSN